MVDVLSKEERTRNMKAIHSKNTRLEKIVSNELWKMGFRFRKNVRELFGTPDIAIKKYKVVIFLDSCFWHGCEKHCRIPKTNTEFWVKKINLNKKRDEEVTAYYKKNGWNILRVWEHQVKENFDDTIIKIANFILTAQKHQYRSLNKRYC